MVSSFCLVFKGTAKNKKKTWGINSNFTIKDSLFRSIKLAKNADPNKYVYSGYGIRLDSGSKFYLPDGRVGKNHKIGENIP